MRRVEDVMVREVVTLAPSASAVAAANAMRESNVGMLPIVENDRLRGVLTDRDLVVRGMAQGLHIGSALAIDCATMDPISARPDWPLDRALEVMAHEHVGRLPVADDEGRLLGVVTLGSLVLRGERPGRALETAKEVSRRSAKRVASRAAKRPEARRKGAPEARPKGKAATRHLRRAS